MKRHMELQVWGRVQGVGFRSFTRKKALALGLTGWVSNVEDGSMQVAAEGEADALLTLETWVRKGPPLAWVERLDARYSDNLEGFENFVIRR
ncbi:MAG: acylphosphatase [bacterium]|nr:acylphosphatase [bacterium]